MRKETSHSLCHICISAMTLLEKGVIIQGLTEHTYVYDGSHSKMFLIYTVAVETQVLIYFMTHSLKVFSCFDRITSYIP